MLCVREANNGRLFERGTSSKKNHLNFVEIDRESQGEICLVSCEAVAGPRRGCSALCLGTIGAGYHPQRVYGAF